MKTYYIKKDKISSKIEELEKLGYLTGDLARIIKEKTVQDHQYLVVEISPAGTVRSAYAIDSSKVPVEVQQREGEVIDSSYYL